MDPRLRGDDGRGGNAPARLVRQATADRSLAAAMATMRRGSAFFGSGLSRSGVVPVSGRSRARFTGNGLRELDRFLNLLIDAALEAGGGDARPNQANTAAKYRAIAPAGAATAADHRRLLALGRSRACLFWCDGVVRRPDDRGGMVMTLGWPDAGGGLATALMGEELRPDAADLGDVARFYLSLATRVAAG